MMNDDIVKIRVDGQWTKRPVDKRIFGNFMESGFGRQIPGMWSEMIYNRAFREVPEYKIATWRWLGVEKEMYNQEAPFWHSGYEENDWELIGEPLKSYSCGNYTYKGKTSLMLSNQREDELCGLRQQGLHLQKGRKYQLRLFAGVRGNIEKAGLNGFGETIHSGEPQILNVRVGRYTEAFTLTTESQIFEWKFVACATEITDISLTFTFEGTVLLSSISLMPEDNLGGWRADVVEKLKEVSPSVVRFPGGCFVSFYNWESSIGDRNKREPQPSFYWGGLEENDVGIDEFMELSQMVGFEPQICFNMMTSTPFKARQLVEYLNADSSIGMGRQRMLNGHMHPYGVKLFEMDNEPGRKWTAKQYANQCVAFAKEMRYADPDIEFMMAAYAYDPSLLPAMLEIVGREINYVIYRQGNPEFVDKIMQTINSFNKKNGTKIRLANTEWLPSCKSAEPFEDPEMPMDFRWCGEIVNDYRKIFSTQQMSWNYALNGAHRLLDYISYGGSFALANFNNMCNTWGQNVIEATKDTCYLSCMGHIFAMFAKVFKPCVASKVETTAPQIFAIATLDNEGRHQIYVINHSSLDITVSLPKGKWRVQAGLRGNSRMSHENGFLHCVQDYMAEVEDNIIVMPGISFLCFRRVEKYE